MIKLYCKEQLGLLVAFTLSMHSWQTVTFAGWWRRLGWMATGGLCACVRAHVCVCVCVCVWRQDPTPKGHHILDLNPCILLFSVVMSGWKQLVAQSCWAAQVTKAQALQKFVLKGVKTFFYRAQHSRSYSTWVFDSCCSYLTAAHHLTSHNMASFFAVTPIQLLIWYFRVLPSGCGVLYYTLNAPLFLYPQPIPLSNTIY